MMEINDSPLYQPRYISELSTNVSFSWYVLKNNFIENLPMKFLTNDTKH